MASGDNHAKQIVIEEAESLANDLQNGRAGDPHTQGKAIALIVKMITPLYQAEFVTISDCRQMHEIRKTGKTTKIKLGPFSIEGHITTALVASLSPIVCCGILGFIVGKFQDWW